MRSHLRFWLSAIFNDLLSTILLSLDGNFLWFLYFYMCFLIKVLVFAKIKLQSFVMYILFSHCGIRHCSIVCHENAPTRYVVGPSHQLQKQRTVKASLTFLTRHKSVMTKNRLTWIQ
jgi:hypothetical protein